LLRWRAGVLGLLLGAAQCALAQSQIVSISIAGTLNKNHLDQLRSAIEKMRGESLPTGLIIILDSAGGDGRAAIQMGRMVRARNAHIFVKGTCRSACVLLFAGGVYRNARAFSIGIHRGRITRNVPGTGEVATNPANDPRDREILEMVERETRDYLLDMGLPGLFDAIQQTPSSQIRLLRTDEAAQLGLLGFDAAYLDRQADTVKSRYGISREQWVGRSAGVCDQCEEDLAEPSKFVACYRAALMKN
jgi:hypothetical protein